MDRTSEINPDLDRERRKADIDVENVSVVLYGDQLQKKRTAGLLHVYIIQYIKLSIIKFSTTMLCLLHLWLLFAFVLVL